MKACASVLAAVAAAGVLAPAARANPWNGKVVLQAFWWDCKHEKYQTDPDGTGGWYTYLAKLAPKLRDLGFDGVWVPPPCKGASGRGGMGYDLFDHYDLGQKFQKGSAGTRFGDQDAFLRMIAVFHANGLDVYPDVVLNHLSGGDKDDHAWGDQKHKTFQYAGFAGPKKGRWLKSWLDFHPNPHHGGGDDEWRKEMFGPDVCFRGRCCDRDCDGDSYMRTNARRWLVWFRKQTDADGFRFDAVKHFPPEVVEDLLYNALDAGKPDADQRRYFAVGEFVVGRFEPHRIDDWASQTKNRCGTFDFAFREALFEMTRAKGFFDLGSLPNFQQKNRFKTVPFVNNHDTWRGVFSDSSGNHASDRTGDPKNGAELIATLDPDGPWAKVAHAAAMVVDGSPQVYYEDLFDNTDTATRSKPDPKTHPTRKYIENLIWCHQKLNFKDGAYKVRFQGSQDLLVIERSGKALVGLNDHGTDAQTATVQTDFGANAALHDYSGSTTAELRTDADGKVTVTVPAKSYCVWGPAGVTGGFAPRPRRTTQEFQMDDDLGDNDPKSLRYGGRLVPADFRTGGAVWVAAGTAVKVWVYADARSEVEVRVCKPTADGAKAADQGHHEKSGTAAADTPLYLEFTADREGYHRVTARLATPGAAPTRAYLKVEYEAPAASSKY